MSLYTENIDRNTVIGISAIHDEFGKWSRERLFTYAQGLRVITACTIASPAHNYT